MENRTVKAAIVGCGNIARTYADQIRTYPEIELLGFADALPERAEDFAARYGAAFYPDLAAVLADPAVELVVNLTIHHAHVDVIAQALQAGKHVYTEKPLAMAYADAARLLALAESQGLRLSSAPTTYMGEPQQTAWKLMRAGRLGQVRLAYAEINHGRIETWHPNPVPFYDVGILWDVAIYPLTVLTAFFGPVRRVSAFGQVVYPDRWTLGGEPYQITTPDTVVAGVEFAQGLLARVSSNFYTRNSKQGSAMEFHGDAGSLYLGSCFEYDEAVEFAPYGEPFVAEPLARPPYHGIEFARGLHEMAQAMVAGRPHRASAVHAAHVVEVIEAIHRSVAECRPVDVISTFVQPQPMDWAQ